MKKYLAYILIVIASIGVFLPQNFLHAQTQPTDNSGKVSDAPSGSCTIVAGKILSRSENTTEDECTLSHGQFLAYNTTTNKQPEPDKNALYNNLSTCNILIRFDNCIVLVMYYIFYAIPSLVVTLAGKTLNGVIISSLDSELYGASFVSTTWSLVRDISNIFFILILLYTGIKTILGMGSSETKSIVANVVIMAILINFSMFFTKVIIDTSNVVALIFYDKITIQESQNGTPTDYDKLLRPKEKDISGGLMAKFDPTQMMTQKFFNSVRANGLTGKINNMSGYGFAGYVGAGAAAGAWLGAIPGAAIGGTIGALSYLTSGLLGKGEIPPTIYAGIIFVAGAMVIATAYAFIVASLSFFSRMLELWMLIIFSPFAFMSFSIPSLAHTEYLGWDNWFKRLISVSFMAPIFMFFMYFIYQVVNTDLWINIARPGDKNNIELMILTLLPGIMVIILLLQAASFAKKGSGQLGEMVMGGAKMLAGLAIGGAALGTASLLRGTVGGGAAALSKRSNVMATLKFDQEYKKWLAGGSQGPAPVSAAQPLGMRDRIGLAISKSQLESGEVAHAVHERDELKKSAGIEGLSDDQISSTDEMRMESEFVKKHKKDIEDEIRAGIGSDGKAITITEPKGRNGLYLRDENGLRINAANEEDFKDQRRKALIKEEEGRRIQAGNNNPLSDADRKKVEGQLNTEFAAILRGMVASVGSLKYEHLKDEALNKKLGMGTQILAKSTSGSYDARKLADVRPGKTDSMRAKIGLGIIAAVATGMRVGLKQGAGVNSGTSQRDLLKDLGNTISEAFKSAKINVDFGGGGGGHDDSHKTSGGGHH